MYQTNKVSIASAIAAVLIGTAGMATQAMASTVLVTPSNMGSWAFANSDVNGTVANNPTGVGQMVTGPATPPLGTGSANIATGAGGAGGDGAEILSTTGYTGTLLSSLTALSYSTYDTLNNGQQFPYLQLEIATGLPDMPYDQLFFEPPYQTPSTGNPGLPDQGSTAMNVWQTWNALTGGWWDNDGLCDPGTGVETLAACTSTFINPTIVNTFGTPGVLDGVGGVQFDVGFANPGDEFNGYVDNFTIGVNGVDTTYNFDPNRVPEPASLAVLSLGLLGLGAIRRRR